MGYLSIRETEKAIDQNMKQIMFPIIKKRDTPSIWFVHCLLKAEINKYIVLSPNYVQSKKLYSWAPNNNNIKKIQLNLSKECADTTLVLMQFQLQLTSASNCVHSILQPLPLAHTVTHILKLRDVSVSAESSFIINLDSEVQWVDVPYSKVNPRVTADNIVQVGQSISPACPLESWSYERYELRQSLGKERQFPCVRSEWGSLRTICAHASVLNHC